MSAIPEHRSTPPAPAPPVEAPSSEGRPLGSRGPLPAHLARDALRRRLLAASDGLAVVLAALIATAGPATSAQLLWTVALLPVLIVLAKLHGLYDRDHRALRHLTVDELPSILAWATLATASTVVLLSMSPAGSLAVGGAVLLWGALVALDPLLRWGARALWRALTPRSSVLLAGTGPLERTTRRKIDLFDDMHLDVLGSIGFERLCAPDALLETRIREACGDLPDRVVVCTPDADEHVLAAIVRFCRHRRIKLSVVPPLRGAIGTAIHLTRVAEVPVVEYHTGDPSVSTLMLKRWLDLVVSACLLVLSAPVLALAAVAIRLDHGGPVFYSQWRAGLDGRPFRMRKLRTMVVGADRAAPHLIPVEVLAQPSFMKDRDDPRLTRVGRVLRRWSLDELPQLVNVLRGEMSLVGPRPEDVAVVERYRPEHRFRLSVVPGMTGPMQVSGRGELEFDERLAVEREYIENFSLGRDLRILLLTIPAVLSGHGAF